MIGVVVVGVLALLLRWFMSMLELGPPITQIIWVVFVLLVVLALAGLFGYGPSTGWWGNRRVD